MSFYSRYADEKKFGSTFFLSFRSGIDKTKIAKKREARKITASKNRRKSHANISIETSAEPSSVQDNMKKWRQKSKDKYKTQPLNKY